jgi:transposase
MDRPQRFTGLKLSDEDRTALRKRQVGREHLSARTWRRIRVLLLLDEGFSVRAAAKAVGGFPREASRVGKRYLEGGIDRALTENARPPRPKVLDSSQEAALVAMVCGPAPEGRARWTVALIATEATKRKIVLKIGRETIRRTLADHDLKPWREKNVVRAANRRRVRDSNGEAPQAVREA